MGPRVVWSCMWVAGFTHHNTHLSLLRLWAPAVICEATSWNRHPLKHSSSSPTSNKSSINLSPDAPGPLACHSQSLRITSYSSSLFSIHKFHINIISCLVFPINVPTLSQWLSSINPSSQSCIFRCNTVFSAVQAALLFWLISFSEPSALSRI